MKKLRIIALAIIALTMASCSQSKKYSDYEQTEGGAYYKIIEANPEGKELALDDVVTFNLDYLIRDSLLFSYTQVPDQTRILMQKSVFKGDLFEAMLKLRIGDSASIILRADSTFIKLFGARKLPPFVKEDDDIRFEIRVLDSKPREEFENEMRRQEEIAFEESEKGLMDYLYANELAAKAVEIEPGLFYERIKNGKGNFPQEGDKVKVHYTGRLLDGTVFDSSIERGEPIEFPLGWGRVIKGWDLGIAKMRKGEKGVLYISSKLGYGSQAVGPIPAFSSLVFDVELVDFEKPNNK